MKTTKSTLPALRIRSGKIPRSQKVTVYGPSGIGKTTLGSHMPSPVLIDTENGSNHLDVARIVVTDWESITTAVAQLANEDHDFRTVVFDTADWLEKRLAEHLCRKFNKDSIEDFGFGKGYVLLAEEFARFLSSLDALLAVGLHVVFLAHSTVRKFDAPDQAGSYDRYELKLTKQCAPLLKEWSDALLFANFVTKVAEKDSGKLRGVGGKERAIFTTHCAAYDAKNRHGLADKIPFSIDALEPLFGFFDIGDRTFMPAPPDPEAQTLTDRIFAAFQRKVDMANVVDFLVARGQLHFTEEGPLESIDNLDPAYAERMFSEPERFIAAVNEWAAAQRQEVAP